MKTVWALALLVFAAFSPLHAEEAELPPGCAPQFEVPGGCLGKSMIKNIEVIPALSACLSFFVNNCNDGVIEMGNQCGKDVLLGNVAMPYVKNEDYMQMLSFFVTRKDNTTRVISLNGLYGNERNKITGSGLASFFTHMIGAKAITLKGMAGSQSYALTTERNSIRMDPVIACLKAENNGYGGEGGILSIENRCREKVVLENVEIPSSLVERRTPGSGYGFELYKENGQTRLRLENGNVASYKPPQEEILETDGMIGDKEKFTLRYIKTGPLCK